MSSFKTTIESIRDKYFTFEEFPLLERDRFPVDCLKKAMLVEKKELEYYAANLKNKEIEGLLLDLVQAQNDNEIERATEILLLRKSGRIIQLTSYLSQYNYNSVGINYLCKKLVKGENELVDKNSYIKKFGNKDDKVDALVQVISKEKQDMEAVCKKYDIIDTSPLALDGFLAFFLDCDKTAFLINYEKVITLIHTFPVEKVHEILVNYLSKLAFVEYSDDVNLEILDILGRPYVSEQWYPFTKELRDKFAQWYYLYQLKTHCKDQPQKFAILEKYFEYVRTNYKINEDNVLITDFGNIVIADVKKKTDAYLYDKFLFEKEMAAWEANEESIPTFMKDNAKVMTARQFMLSTDEARCIKLTFADIDYYYIDEVLEIKLGLEPDMRSDNLK